MLKIENLQVHYGGIQALRGISLEVPDGRIVTLIGANGKLNPNAKLGYSDGQYYYTPDDWYDELFGSGNLRQEYNVSVAGASERLNYYLSAGYLDDSGIIKNSGFTRYRPV